MLKGLPNTVNWADFTRIHRILDTDVPYRDVAEPWQIEIDDGIASKQCAYLQLARGHDKTDRYAWWSMLWLSTTEASRGYAAGVDRDNAALFRDSSRKLKALHPDLFMDIDVQKNLVINTKTGSYIETISSDADSAYGLNFDLLIINDFHAWPDEKFWEVLWTACGKKPGIRIWMESNALTLGSEGAHWVAKFRKWVSEQQNKEWFYYNPPRFLASWQKPQLEKWQATLHPSAYRRLIENQDTSGDESFVTPEQVEAITTLPSPYQSGSLEGRVITAVDLGLKKDATAIATLLSHPVIKGTPPKLTLLALDTLTGTVNDPVRLSEVRRLILSHREMFKSKYILLDPWNAQEIIQTIPGAVEWTFTTAHVRELTQLLYRAIADRALQIYPNAGNAYQDGEEWTLQRELINAVLKDCSYGQRVDHKAGGYSDRLMAIGMCVHHLLSELSTPRPKQPKLLVEKKWDLNGSKIIGEWDEALGQSSSPMGLLRIGGNK